MAQVDVDALTYVWATQRRLSHTATRVKRSIKRWRTVSLVLAVVRAIAATLGVVAAVTALAGVGVWVAVATTIACAVTAHVAAARYQFVVLSYRAAARRLRSLERSWLAGDTGDVAALVREAEELISRQTTAGWPGGCATPRQAPATQRRFPGHARRTGDAGARVPRPSA
jgi:hypothetical protein